MLESSFRNLVAAKRFPETFVGQLQRFTTSLIGQGYADRTVRQKLRVFTNFGQWLGRNNLAVKKLDASSHQIHPSGCTQLSVAQTEKSLSARVSTQRSHGPSSPRCGSLRDCALARSRIRRDNRDVSSRGHAAEGESALAHWVARSQTQAIPAGGQTVGLPRKPLIMPSQKKARAPSR
jgi:hypothetical protein